MVQYRMSHHQIVRTASQDSYIFNIGMDRLQFNAIETRQREYRSSSSCKLG